MTVGNPIFQQLSDLLDQAGPLPTIERLVGFLRETQQYRELFEALKMHHRIEAGLPAVTMEGTAVLTSEQQDWLERKLLDACREVGSGLLSQGKLEEGWMYMRPVGDRAAAAAALAEVQVTPDNLDAMLHILVQEGVDVAQGVRLSLEHRGTCNTITMMDSVVSLHGRSDQQAGVDILVRHVHRELIASLQADWLRREKSPTTVDSANALLELRPNWLRDGSYHLDTTHLSSTVRFARVLDQPESLRMALDLAHYGRRLHPQYQYPGEEPFTDLYAMSITYFEILLGERVDASLKVFLQKAESLDPDEHGTIAVETYADLLARIGRPREALQFLLKRTPTKHRPCGVAPSLLELSQMARDFSLMLNHTQERGDLVGYAAALLQSATLPAETSGVE